MSLLAKLARRSPSDLFLAAEALTLLVLFRIALAFIPVRKIIPTLTRNRPLADPHPDDIRTRRVRWAVDAVARHSPLTFVCFPQTLAGYAMLRLRNIPATMVYGIARSPSGELMTHTWLTVGDWIMLGADVAPQFTPIERWT